MRGCACAREWGSSPLARGLPASALHRARGPGIIPARAGFTSAARARARPARDHPRSRGVYRRRRPLVSPARGSSPLARGLPFRRVASRRVAWIIPARAGFTRPVTLPAAETRDHPRSRGVYLRAYTRRCVDAGIIPARAGFTVAHLVHHVHHGDHPRSRGVYVESATVTGPDTGSSPLARGLRTCPCTGSWRRRIIPARAGFTGGRPLDRRLPGDHPRSRGVYSYHSAAAAAATGSSPLARGLLGTTFPYSQLPRIIPARAGFTPRPRRATIRSWDHPRSRGVYR